MVISKVIVNFMMLKRHMITLQNSTPDFQALIFGFLPG